MQPSNTDKSWNRPRDESAGPVVTEEMDCPQAKVGTVIGARGIIVQEIMRRSGCKVVVNQDGFPEGAPRKVVITGLSHQIPLAKTLIEAVIAEGPGAIQTAGGDGSDAAALMINEMECPSDKVGIVIGSRGIIIQDIMRRSGCKIVVNQRVPQGAPSIVQITGKAGQIAEAKRLITAVIQNGPHALNTMVEQGGATGPDADVVVEEMDCPPEKVGIVIGAKGVIINEIMRRSGTKIVINQDVPQGNPNIIVITGPRYRIAAAKGLITSVITGGPNALQMGIVGHNSRPTVHEFPIVQAQVGKVIGPGGSTIKEIQQHCGVRINIEVIQDSDERIVRVTGEPERVLYAVQVIWQLLQQGAPAAFGMMRSLPPAAAAGRNNWGAGAGGAPPMHAAGGAWGAPRQAQGHAAWGHAAVAQSAPVSAPVAAAGVQYLGSDGKAGQLMPAASIGNGYHHQVALIHSSWFDILSGGSTGPNLALIRAKSGARVSVDESALERDRTHVKVDIVGFYASVSLAAQMIQEVLVYGTGRLEVMEDAKVGPALGGADSGSGGAYMNPAGSNRLF